MPAFLLVTSRTPGRTKPPPEVDFVDASSLVLEGLLRKHGGALVRSCGEISVCEFPLAPSALACALALQARCAKDNGARKDPDRVFLRMGLHVTDTRAAELLLEAAPFGRIYLSREVHAQSQGANLCFVAITLEYFRDLPEPLEIFEAIQRVEA